MECRKLTVDDIRDHIVELVNRYWTECGKPIRRSTLTSRFGWPLSRLGYTVQEALRDLRVTSLAHSFIVETGAEYFVPKSAWDAMEECDQMLIIHEINERAGELRRRSNQIKTLRKAGKL